MKRFQDLDVGALFRFKHQNPDVLRLRTFDGYRSVLEVPGQPFVFKVGSTMRQEANPEIEMSDVVHRAHKAGKEIHFT